MSEKPIVSIIIPVYNVEKYLRRCLDSVLKQTFDNWEAVCVNDGSPDNSAAILDEYAAHDSRFVVITKKNGGLSDARNVGTAAARGKYVFYLDSDDFIHAQTLEMLCHFAEKENADMVNFKFDELFHKKLKLMMMTGRDIDGILPESRKKKYDVNSIAAYVTDNILGHSTERNHGWGAKSPVRYHCFAWMCLYKRELIQDLPFIYGIIMEDFPWWSAVMLRHPKTVMINVPLYFYMPNAVSILSSSKVLRIVESISVGLEYVYKLYLQTATEKEFEYYNREFLWPFIIMLMHKVHELSDASDIMVAKKAISKLADVGLFDRPTSLRAYKYQRRIKRFIK